MKAGSRASRGVGDHEDSHRHDPPKRIEADAGAGKTTLLEILAGLRNPTGGELHLDAQRDAIAYCPDVAEFEPWLTALEVLESALGLLGRRRPRPELAALLGTVSLSEVADRRVGGFSRGMTTRLNLAVGLAGEPKVVLLLDEPASSLDPAGRVDALELIKALALCLVKRGIKVPM